MIANLDGFQIAGADSYENVSPEVLKDKAADLAGMLERRSADLSKNSALDVRQDHLLTSMVQPFYCFIFPIFIGRFLLNLHRQLTETIFSAI